MVTFETFWKFRFLIALISVVGVAIAVLGASSLAVTPDNRVFYGPDNAHYQTLLEFENTFEVNSVVVFAITSDASFLKDRNMREAVAWIAAESPGIRNFVRASSIASVSHPVDKDNELQIIPLLEYVCPDECLLDRTEVVTRPEYVGRLISPDLKSAAIYVVVDVDEQEAADVTETQKSVDHLAEEFREKFPTLALNVTGAVPMMQAFVDTATDDAGSVILIAFVVVLILLCFCFGSIETGFAVFFTGFFAALVPVGVLGWFGGTLNTATSVVPLIVFTLVVAGSIHLVAHYLHRFDDGSVDPFTNLKASYSAQYVPMILAAATSCAGLLSLVTVTSPPIRELGILSSVGVASGLVLGFGFLGPILTRRTPKTPSLFQVFMRRRVNSYVRTLERQTQFAWLGLVVFALFSLGILFLEIDDDFVRYFDDSVEFRAQSEAVVRHRISSPYHLELIVGSDKGSALDPAVLKFVAQLEDELRRSPLVLNVSSVRAVLVEVSRALDIDSDDWDRDTLSQLFLAYEMGLSPGQTSRAFVSPDMSMVRVSVLLKDVTSLETRAIEEAVYEFHHRESPEGLSVVVTGENIPVAYLSGDNIKEMLASMLVMFVFICLAFALAARQLAFFWLGVLSVGLPIAAGFGLWGAFVGTIGLASSIILAVTVGVVVDDAIHVLYRFQDGRKNLDLDRREAAAYAIFRTGPAIVTTSICLILGFSMLSLSAYSVNVVFGIIASMIFGLALLFDLIVLPNLLALETYKIRTPRTV